MYFQVSHSKKKEKDQLAVAFYLYSNSCLKGFFKSKDYTKKHNEKAADAFTANEFVVVLFC